MVMKKGNKLIPVVVTPAEKAAIEANAEGAGMSVSQFLRTLGLGYEPKGVIADKKDMETLVQIHGNQGRLGGLLKMWLTDKSQYNSTQEVTIHKLLEDLTITQGKMLEGMDAILANIKKKGKR